MANPYHHAVSSARQWGGKPEDYLAVHTWFDESKAHLADFRHRALRHHAQGIFWAEEVFGPTVTITVAYTCPHKLCGDMRLNVLPDGSLKGEPEHHALHVRRLEAVVLEPVTKEIPTRWVGEQHVMEDLGRIPTMADWFRSMKAEPWMNRSRKLSAELERGEAVA